MERWMDYKKLMERWTDYTLERWNGIHSSIHSGIVVIVVVLLIVVTVNIHEILLGHRFNSTIWTFIDDTNSEHRPDDHWSHGILAGTVEYHRLLVGVLVLVTSLLELDVMLMKLRQTEKNMDRK
jgi:uncharacterized membrane protein YidH (DUF202 family)